MGLDDAYSSGTGPQAETLHGAASAGSLDDAWPWEVAYEQPVDDASCLVVAQPGDQLALFAQPETVPQLFL